MAQATFEHMCQQFEDTTHKATQAASAVVDALQDSVVAVRRAARNGTEAASEIFYDAKKRMQRHPIETVAVTFVVGLSAGAALGWAMRRKRY
jgi:ElaB/YqjD/DUF883 family membrane-anchored ribosome-binding protein